MTTTKLVVACLLAVSSSAVAQPKKPPPESGGKVDAKSLMQSGVRLLEAKDYLGALAVFRDAYARFASAKILLNIGTTLRLLDRLAEAANTYQRYLESPDVSAAKKPEVTKVLAELDRKVGILELTVTPEDAEVKVVHGDSDSDSWVPAATFKRSRVQAGSVAVEVRHPKFKPTKQSTTVRAGESIQLSITLDLIPEVMPETTPTLVDAGVRVTAAPRARRSRLGVLALAHLDIPDGGAAVVGLTADLTSRIQVQAAAILGPVYGGYAGATVAVLPGRFRPIVSAGIPIFASDGARFALRGAGGIEVQLNRHLALIAEVGLEYMLNPEDDIEAARFIPAVGASGRL
ncbi:MAG: hypothetical protein WKG01_28665 [Kofleriaceae bacterium]